MKKIVLFLSCSLISLWGVEWVSYEDALKLQKKTNKIIMIDAVRTNCRYCVKMDENVFNDKEMSKWLSERFIPVKLDVDFDDMPLDIKVKMTPSFYFIDKESKVIKMIPGSWSIEDFKSITKDIR